MTKERQQGFLRQLRSPGTTGNKRSPFAELILVSFGCRAEGQSLPIAPDALWHYPQQKSVERDARKILSTEFFLDHARAEDVLATTPVLITLAAPAFQSGDPAQARDARLQS